jgi:RNA polymerase sigma-70 factor (ECF subfamily)
MPSSLTLDRPFRPTPAIGSRPGAAKRERDNERKARRKEDAALALRARGGDEDAFRTLVEKYQKRVYWIAYDILLDGEEARDVAQETFIRVYGALGSFDPARDFLNWIYRIARNLAIDAFRRRRRRAVPVEDLTAHPLPDTSAATDDGSLRERVATVLADLPVDYRLSLTLREFHGMSPREIASLTDCTYPTARWRLHRARALFRKHWEKRYGAQAMEDHS